MIRRTTLLGLLALFVSPAWSQTAPQLDLPKVTLKAGMHLIHAQVASTPEQRATGLMFRSEMPANEGMLFVFEESAGQCFWMKNTLLPLSVAFLDEQGRILNIEDMKPQTEDNHCAARPATFALEMNHGWFRQKGIAPGARIGGVEALGGRAR